MGTPSEPDDPALMAEAQRIFSEYALWRFAGISYQAMGYHTGDGVTLWVRKMDEHWLCHQFVTEAVAERHESTHDG